MEFMTERTRDVIRWANLVLNISILIIFAVTAIYVYSSFEEMKAQILDANEKITDINNRITNLDEDIRERLNRLPF